MAKRAGWRQVTGLLVVAGLLLAGYSVYRVPLRVHWLVAQGEPPASDAAADEAAAEIRALGIDARGPLLAILDDDAAGFERKAYTASLLLGAPFFDAASVETAIGAASPTTARAAVFVLMGGDTGRMPSFQEAVGEALDRRPLHLPTAPLEDWEPTPAAVGVLGEWVADIDGAGAGHAAVLLGRVKPGTPEGDAAREALLAVVRTIPDSLGAGAAPELRVRKLVYVNALQALLPHVAADPAVLDEVTGWLRWVWDNGDPEIDWDLQMYMLDVLSVSRGRGIDEQLTGLLRELALRGHRVVRQKVAGVLEDMSFPGRVELLTVLLADEVPTVRRAAVLSLKGRQDPALNELAPYLVEDAYIYVRADTCRAVGELRGVDPVGTRANLPLLVECLEDPWPGGTGPVAEDMTAFWTGGRSEVIQGAVLSLFLVLRKHPGFETNAIEFDWKAREARAQELITDDAARLAIVAEWRDSIIDLEPRDRVPFLVRRLSDRDPDCVLRAMRELARITGDAHGFPEGLPAPGGDDTAARNRIREWMKNGREASLAAWQPIADAVGDFRKR